MIYIHQYFSLDTEKKKVFDENGRELYLTGNAYWLLLLLCEKFPQSLSLTDIDTYFETIVCSKGTKGKGEENHDYTEDYIRRLRNDIRRAINQQVVEYKNKVYSIIGEVEKREELILPIEKETMPLSLSIFPKDKATKTLYFILIFLLVVFLFSSAYHFQKFYSLSNANKASIENDMILIPEGNFIFGSTEEEALFAFQLCETEEWGYCLEEDYLSEYPRAELYLPDFYIDRKEVSNEDFQKFVETTKRAEPAYFGDTRFNQPSQPVVGVSWQDAVDYCEWLGKRLPTEQEWEKSARGTDGNYWPWGNIWDGSKLNHGKGGLPGYDDSDGYKYSAPVGVELGVSPFGALNMAGNVSEWVFDDFNPYKGNDRFLNESFMNSYKVIRGGSYIMGGAENRTSVRFYDEKEYYDDNLGFRCAKDI